MHDVVCSWGNTKSVDAQPSEDTIPLWKDSEEEAMKALSNTNQILSIVKQEPDGKMELLQQHHKNDLAKSQVPIKRDNSVRRSTIHAPDQKALYGPSRRKRTPSMSPTNSIFTFRRLDSFFMLIAMSPFNCIRL